MMKTTFFAKKDAGFYALLLILAGLAAWLLLYDMHYGPWAYSDSVEYIVSAKSLLAGQGLGIPSPEGGFMPLTLHPPFYSLLLAPFLALGLDAFAVIKAINTALFCLTLLILGIGVYRMTRSALAGLSVSALFLLAPAMLRDFDGAMSEPVFIFLSVLNLFLLLKEVFQPSKWSFWGAVVCAGLAMLTRYIGAASIFVSFFLLLFFPAQPWKKNALRAVGYAVFSAVPTAIWLLYTASLSGSLASRSINSGLSLSSAVFTLRAELNSVLIKWLPFRETWYPTWSAKIYTVYAVILVSALLFAALLWKWYRARKAKAADPEITSFLALVTAALLYCAGYLGFLLLSLFSSIPPDLNERMYSPIQPMVWIILFGTCYAVIRAYRLPALMIIVPVLLAVLLGYSFWQQTYSDASDRYEKGDGYAGPDWKNSPTLQAVKELPADIPFISNEEAAVLFYTGKFPYEISELGLSAPLANPGSFGSGDTKEEAAFREKGAALILFWDTFNDQLKEVYDTDSDERLAQLIKGLTPYVETEDGAIYFYSESVLPGQ